MTTTQPIPVSTALRHSTPVDDGSRHASRRDWIGLVALVLAVFIICIDATVLDLAVPAISAALQPSATQLLWIIDVYSFIVAGLLVTMGALGDRIGRRKLLLIGAAAFAGASLLAAFAPSAEWLIAARALLGVAGATLMPSTLGLIRTMFPNPTERSRAIGIWAAVAGSGTAAGPLLGGWLLEHFWWGSVFLLNVPVMVILLVAVPLLVAEARDPNPGRFDVLSSLLSIAGIIALVFAIKESAAHGVHLEQIVAAGAGTAFLWWFVRRQRRLSPMLDLGLFRRPQFSAGVAANGLSAFAFAGVLFFGSQYLQSVLGFGPLGAGLLMLPGIVVSIVGALLAAPLERRIGAGRTIAVSLASGALGAVVLAFVGRESGPAAFVVGYTLLGVTAGVITALASDLVVGAAPVSKASSASSISEMAYELGLSLGVAVLGSVVMSVYRAGLVGVAADGTAAFETIGTTMDHASAVGGVAGAEIAIVAGDAFVAGMHVAAIASAVVLAITGLLADRMLRGATRAASHA